MDEENAANVITSLCWVKRGHANVVSNPASGFESMQMPDTTDAATEDDMMAGYDDEQALPKFAESDRLDGDDQGSDGETEEIKKLPNFIEDDEEEKDDYKIRKSDSLIVTATAQNDQSNLEVYLFEEETSTLYVHHEIMLATFPLCMQWIPYFPGSGDASKSANFLAVGTFMPVVEIWNLDELESVQPAMLLGATLDDEYNPSNPASIQKGAHASAVMSMSLNKERIDVLATGSADTTVKVWDLATQKPVSTLKHHSNKVQVVEWNPNDSNALLSASLDSKAFITNAQDPKAKLAINLRPNLEKGMWNPHDQNICHFTYEDGIVQSWDVRNLAQPLNEF